VSCLNPKVGNFVRTANSAVQFLIRFWSITGI